MAADAQEQLVHRCAPFCCPCFIIVGTEMPRSAHEPLTSFTEVLSTRFSVLTRTAAAVFPLIGVCSRIAQSCGLSVHSEQNDRYTSNTIYVLQKV
jgi:hypothetical protein